VAHLAHVSVLEVVQAGRQGSGRRPPGRLGLQRKPARERVLRAPDHHGGPIDVLDPAVLVAVLAALSYGLSASVQHVAVGRTRQHELRGHRLLVHLCSRPGWLLGTGLALAAFALHAAALNLGSLAVVQPVVVCGVVLAVPVRAWMARRWPSGGELATVAVTAAGVALFLVAARPDPGHLPGSPWAAVSLTGGGAAVAAVAAVSARRCRSSRRTGFLLGLASGVLFGLVAGLLKLTSAQVSAGSLLTLVTSWPAWTVLVIGAAGVATTQHGYRATGMSASLCALNMTDVVVALVFGLVVFGEVPAHDVTALLLEAVAVLLVIVGLRRLGRPGAQDGPPAAV
jgi:drug/metabolite transporter (DMT)-like permease